MKTNLKITVVRTFNPEDVFGPDHGITRNGKPFIPCDHKEGEEFIVSSQYKKPEGLCERAWQDLYSTIMVYHHGGDYNFPSPGATYEPCGDGVNPVVFKIEKMED
ncbi:TIGR04076 family protein [Candidatus Thorarchaeota archaeon]|nr:MAG: TIGR04076 family protein [Candidatus Thorarchaeota archaeon]